MPGIVTLIDQRRRPDLPARFRHLQAATQLKPWLQAEAQVDTEGLWAIGRTDLGLINRAPQPLTSHDGRYRLCFYGELYDVAERLQRLKGLGTPLTGHESPDLLLGAYREDGLAGISPLNGSYFFALWDQHEQRLIVGGDRYATRPHFYAFQDGRFLLAPTLQGILAGLDELPPYCWQAICEFLALEFPLADRTFFEGIHVFPGGTFLVLDAGGPSWHPYWTVRYRAPDEPRARQPEAYLDEALNLYRQAVARRMAGPIGLPVSGGIDSRLIAALATRRDVPALSMGAPDSDDLRFARQVVQVLGHPHIVLPLPQDYLAQNAHETIALGDGMSSLFHAHNSHPLEGPSAIHLNGMYSEFSRLHYAETVLAERPRSSWHQMQLWARQIDTGRLPLVSTADDETLLARLLAAMWNIVPLPLAQTVLQPELAQTMAAAVPSGLNAAWAAVEADCLTDRVASLFLLHRHRRFGQWGLKQSSHFKEFRLPLADYDLVDFLLTLPAATRRNLQAQVICRANPRLAAIPRTPNGLPLHATRLRRATAHAWLSLDKRLFPGRRQTFSDPQQGLRTYARSFYEEVLLDPASLGNGIFQPDGIRRLLAAHMSGQSNQANAICALATLELWRRTYNADRTFAAVR